MLLVFFVRSNGLGKCNHNIMWYVALPSDNGLLIYVVGDVNIHHLLCKLKCCPPTCIAWQPAIVVVMLPYKFVSSWYFIALQHVAASLTQHWALLICYQAVLDLEKIVKNQKNADNLRRKRKEMKKRKPIYILSSNFVYAPFTCIVLTCFISPQICMSKDENKERS